MPSPRNALPCGGHDDGVSGHLLSLAWSSPVLSPTFSTVFLSGFQSYLYLSGSIRDLSCVYPLLFGRLSDACLGPSWAIKGFSGASPRCVWAYVLSKRSRQGFILKRFIAACYCFYFILMRLTAACCCFSLKFISAHPACHKCVCPLFELSFFYIVQCGIADPQQSSSYHRLGQHGFRTTYIIDKTCA